MTNDVLKALGLANATNTTISQCELTTEDVSAWLATLPQANLGETARALFQIVNELSTVEANAQFLDVLNVLYPAVRDTTAGLARHYLNQPVILPAKAQQVVDLADTLQEQMANCYIRAVISSDQNKKGLFRKSNNETIQFACYRGTQLFTEMLIRCYQFYASPTLRLWQKLHLLHRIAARAGVANTPLNESSHVVVGFQSVESAYLNALLLGCIKANQLRQEDLTLLHKLLPQWSMLAQIAPLNHESSTHLFAFNPAADEAPVYAALLNELEDTGLLGIDTHALVQNLRDSLLEARNNKVNVDGTSVSVDLLKHLILAWGQCSKRSFMRIETETKLQICTGLASAHHFASEQLSYEDMIDRAIHFINIEPLNAVNPVSVETNFAEQELENKPHEPKPDPWNDAIDAAPLTPQHANIAMETIDYQINSDSSRQSDRDSRTPEQFCNYKVDVLNASPGGYSLSWLDTDATKIQAGDLVSIREENIAHWSVGVIRWLHRPNKSELQFGIELLSPAYLPSIARILSGDKEPSDFMRILLLPAISVTAQPKTILVPHMRFRAGQRIQILDGEQVRTITLTEQVSYTGSYAQFAYRSLDAANDSNIDDIPGNEENKFDSLWNTL